MAEDAVPQRDKPGKVREDAATKALRGVIATGQFVIVAGAGVTIAATRNAKVAGWKGLLHNGVDRCIDELGESDVDADLLRRQIDSQRVKQMLTAAEEITDLLGGRDGKAYDAWIRETVGQLTPVDPAVPEALIALGGPIVTTNYDGILCDLSKRPPLTWQQAGKLRDVLIGQRKGIIHIHGHFDDARSVVLGVDSYYSIIGEGTAQALQEAIAALKTLVFVGCGGTLDDPNLGALLQRFAASGHKHQHFQLVNATEQQAIQQEKRGTDAIRLVRYGDDFGHLAPFLASLVTTPKKAGGKAKHPKAPTKAPALPRSSPAIDAYRQWALKRHGNLDLIGFERGDVALPLNDVFVPLRFRGREDCFGDHGGAERMLERMAERELSFDDLFRVDLRGTRHRLILGQPGAGKTTALKKVLHQMLTAGPDSLGLPDAETLPVLLRLRRLTQEHLQGSMQEFVAAEILDVAGTEVNQDVAREVAAQPHLVLLLDGLDEIADLALRQRACQWIHTELARSEAAGHRAIVSSRHAGYGAQGGRQHVKLDDGFALLEVAPLQPEQQAQLVRRWFAAAARFLPEYSEQQARRRAEELAHRLDPPDADLDALRTLVSVPLLLTLMCIVVQKTGDMPKKRAVFYGECLKILLERWQKTARGREPLVEAGHALAVLRPLAWKLHLAERRDDLSGAEFARFARPLLQERRIEVHPMRLLTWLDKDAAVLERVDATHYGFRHLGIQEYLAAQHIAQDPSGAALDELVKRLDEKWWHEVALLLAGLPQVMGFRRLVERALRDDTVVRHGDLLRTCLEEAADVVLEPFLDCLARARSEPRKAAVLRLLRGHGDDRVAAAAAKLVKSKHTDLKALAEQWVDEHQRRSAGESVAEHDWLLAFAPQDGPTAQKLADALRSRGARLYGAKRPPDWHEWQGELASIEQSTRGVLVIIGGADALPWDLPDLHHAVAYLAEEERRVVVVRGPGSPAQIDPPAEFGAVEIVDLRRGFTDVGLMTLLRVAPKRDASRRGIAASSASKPAILEPIPGLRLLPIPGGEFEMGSNDDLIHERQYDDWHRPAHRVIVRPFLLAETVITNAQYRLFLDANPKHKKPDFWTDRRFSAPDQPVVGVSWDDAMAFCAWLAKESGLAIELPTEARWEFAARGRDGRRYPWGNEKPDKQRACFATDKPTTVGAFPTGRGPFGTLDQAGLVWEWCRDGFDEKVYARRSKSAPVEEPFLAPEGVEGRVLRGGAWLLPVLRLASAFRSGGPAALRSAGVGFRVSSAPASTAP